MKIQTRKTGKLLIVFLLISLAVVCAAQFAGGSGTEADPWQIETAEHLDNVRDYIGVEHSSKRFLQIANIVYNRLSWNPISPFHGTYDGGGFVVDSLKINRYIQNAGLFGITHGARIRNLGLTNLEIVSARDNTGALVGYARDFTMIDNCYATGVIKGETSVGGLVGYSMNDSRITNSYSEVKVTGTSGVGGLAGFVSSNSRIEHCYATGDVSGFREYIGGVGGLVGRVSDARVFRSFSTGNVKGSFSVGGLVGEVFSSNVIECFSRGIVEGNSTTGGLVGYNNHNSTISNSYATGNAISYIGTGGLVGVSRTSGIINSFSSGGVNHFNNAGGLVGRNDDSVVENSYWDVLTSGKSESEGGEGRETVQLLQRDNYPDWDFDEIWEAVDDSYPVLHWQPEETRDNIPAPFNLVAEPATTEIRLSWNEHNLQPLGYNLYKDGEIENEELITDTYFTDQDVTLNQTYSYYLTAVYEDGLSSLPSAILFTAANAFSGGSGTPEDPLLIDNVRDLRNISYFPNSHYRQISDIDLNSSVIAQTEWIPIGSGPDDSFRGVYDGNGYSIHNLYINRHNENYQGLFGYVNTAVIKNVRLDDAQVTGSDYTGALVGYTRSSTIKDCSVKGAVTGRNLVGGLIGYAMGGTIDNCHSFSRVIGEGVVGGLIGYTDHSASTINSSSRGDAGSSGDMVGGLIGRSCFRTLVKSCYSYANAYGIDGVGGLIGNARYATVKESYSFGNVEGRIGVGGLIGSMSEANLSNSYSRGFVNGEERVGGLVGYIFIQTQLRGDDDLHDLITDSYPASNPEYRRQNIIVNCFSTGLVRGNEGFYLVGGMIGTVNGSFEMINSYWDIQTSGRSTSRGGFGRTTNEMIYPYAENTFVIWDFDEIWASDDDLSVNEGYPYLRNVSYVSIDDDELEKGVTPNRTTLQGNYPNPFNPETTISFSLAEAGEVLLEVFNIKGQKVATVMSERRERGSHQVIWDGKDNNRRQVGSGVYFYRMRSADYTEVRKMIVLR